MHSDAQAGQSAGLGCGVLGGGSVNHEAGEAQDALLVSPDHGVIDFPAGAEVVCGHDEYAGRFHWASWKGGGALTDSVQLG